MGSETSVLSHRVDDTLGRLKRAQCCNKKMLVLNEQAVILDRVAECLDLVADLSLVLELRVKGKVSSLGTEIIELDWAWVAVMVSVSPSSLNSLHSLVGFSVKINFLTWNN